MFALMKGLLIRYWKTIVWIVVMCYLLFSPGSALPKTGLNVPYADKIAHAGMFAVLVFLFCLDSRNTGKSKIRIGILILGVFAFGILSEYLQHAYIPGRSGNVYDCVADVIGIITGLFFYFAFGNKIASVFPTE